MSEQIKIPIEQLEKLESFIAHAYREDDHVGAQVILDFHAYMDKKHYDDAAKILREGLALHSPEFKYPTGRRGLPTERILAEKWANRLETPSRKR